MSKETRDDRIREAVLNTSAWNRSALPAPPHEKPDELQMMRDMLKRYINQNPIENTQWQYDYSAERGFYFNGNQLHSHGLLLAVLLWEGNSGSRADFALVNYETRVPENRIHRKLLFQVLKEEDIQFITNPFCNGEDNDDDLVELDKEYKTTSNKE